MSLPRFFRSALFVAMASTVIYAPSCSQKAASTDEVLRQGAATDAALSEFLAATPDSWAWAGGVFDAPQDQDVLPAATPETFTWHADTSAATGALVPATKRSSSSPAHRFVGLGPERIAWADSAPLTGTAYLLVFSTPTNSKLLRVFTTLPSYTPDAAAWRTLVAVAGPITLSLTTGTFNNDALTSEGGPHKGQSLTFTIQ